MWNGGYAPTWFRQVSPLLLRITTLTTWLCKKYSTDFHKIRLKGGTWAPEVWSNLDHVTLGRGTAILRMGGCVARRVFNRNNSAGGMRSSESQFSYEMCQTHIYKETKKHPPCTCQAAKVCIHSSKRMTTITRNHWMNITQCTSQNILARASACVVDPVSFFII